MMLQILTFGGPFLLTVLGGYVAVSPPNKKYKWWFVAAFILVGAATVYGQIRMQSEVDSKLETMLTGGADYAYFRADPSDLSNGKGPYQLWLVGIGNVYAVNYWISPESAHMNGNDPAYGSLDAIKPRIDIVNSGPHASTRTLPLGDYIIQFAAKNGEWHQKLRFFIADGHVQQTVSLWDQAGKLHEIDVSK